MLNPVLPAAAAVLVLVLVEVALSAWLGRGLHRLPDTLSSLGSSMGQLVVMAMAGFTTLAMYTWLHAQLAVVPFPTGPLGWVLAFGLMELVFYWRHRAGHELAALWTIHEVHHQSSEYNYAVALRVGYLQWVHTAVFIVPLAVLGIDPVVFGGVFAVIHFWQFLIHTRLVGRLGPLEHVLVTPSHHRVHHARNPRYLDRNFGFTLLIFDRIFGTFQAEDEAPEYGTLAPLDSYSPVDNNVRPWLRLAHRMARAPSLAAAASLPFRHPSWDPVSRRRALPAPGEVLPPHSVPAARTSPARVVTAVALFAVAVVGVFVLVQAATAWSTPVRLAVGLGILGLTVVATTVLTQPLPVPRTTRAR